MTRGKPNILLIVTDQHRYDSVGCNGAHTVRTPNLDALAAGGVRFTNACTCTPLCSPARTTMMTGCFPHNHGVLSNMGNFNGVFDRLRPEAPRIYSALQAAGYRCGYVGGWHMPKDEMEAVDDLVAMGEYQRLLKEKGVDWDMLRDEVARVEFGPEAPFCGRTPLPEALTSTAWMADRSCDLLDRYAEQDQPFFLQVSFFGPHFPITVPEPYDTLYDPEPIPMWGNFLIDTARERLILQKERWRWNVGHLSWPMWQKIIATYWGYCTFIDHHIGRVLARLAELGMEKDTLVIFTPDHGDNLGGHKLFNKGFSMYDETLHIPMLMRWPGKVGEGTVHDGFVSLVDLAPTLAHAAGLDPAWQGGAMACDGQSMLDFVDGTTPPREDILAEFHGYETTLYSQRMVRSKNWKYVYNPADRDELYDLCSDPWETQNLAEDLACAPVLARMKDRLMQWMEQTGDTLSTNTGWQGNSYDLRPSPRH